MMSSSITGQILRVDLGSRKISREMTEKYVRWIGGMGVGERILFEEVKPWMTPYDPGNKLVISSGPINGTIFPGSGRIAAVTKSPMTMGIASGNAGGHFSAAMKYAGFDHIVLGGRSTKPVYLYICDGEAVIIDADPIVGMTISETDDWLKKKHGFDISTFAIGPAGENMNRGACIMVDKYRAIGKCGFGAVMGAKNLKVIAVKGTQGVSVYDDAGFFYEVDNMYQRIENNNGLRNFLKYGTLAGVHSKAKFGGFCFRHFQDLNIPDPMCEEFDGKNACDRFRECQTSCAGCMVGCQNRFRIESGPYAGLVMEGTQFNSALDFGSKLDIPDFAFCVKATDLCNEMGIDIDVAAETIGWAMECCEKGILTSQDFDGLEPRFGDQVVSLKIIEKMAYRDGVGNYLAEGVARASTFFKEESRSFAMHIKGNDQYEPMRSIIGYGLGAAVSTRGGSHVLGSPLCETAGIEDHELARRKFGIETYNDPKNYDGKPQLVKYYEILTRACSCLGLCLFVCDWQEIHLLDLSDINRLLKVCTGIDISDEELEKTMIALLNLEKVFNFIHAGFTRIDDYPHPRLFKEKVKSGPASGMFLDKKKWDEMLDIYYEIHGWDKENGLPTPETLRKLDLDFAIDFLEKPAKAPGKTF